MMPRRISRAPPRSENEGACIIVCASTAAKCLGRTCIRLRVHQLAGDLRDFLFDQRAEVLHQRRLQGRIVAGLQHARRPSGTAAAAS